MKKILALLLVVMMLFVACTPANNTTGKEQPGDQTQTPDDTNKDPEDEGKDTEPTGQREPAGQIIYGSTTELSGDFWTSMWGNNASDAVIKDLIHGYGTVIYSKEESAYAFDKTVVKEVKDTVNADGTKTYTFTLNEDLVYSDKTPITAKDYVFALLAGSHPAMAETGADATAGYYYIGFDEYADGTKDVFPGVRLLGDYEFSVTVKAEELPYFFDITYAGVGPWPMHIIAPNAGVEDTAEGAKLTGEFTTDIINETVLNNETGYRFKPTVSCGPYVFESFDVETQIAVVKSNPLYKGDYNGQKAQIEKVIVKKTLAATELDELAAGTVDILPQVGGADAIPPGLDLADEGKIQYQTFPRNGFGYIQFVCDIGPTQFQEVRQAIACLLDVPEFARQYSGGYATTVYGYYGVAQWMYKENAAAIEKDFDKYTLDLARAEKLLVDGGWTLDENGGEYVKGEGKIRHKKLEDGTLMPLFIKHLSTVDNPVSTLISTMLPGNMAQVGMGYEQTQVDFPVLLDHFYGEVEERIYNMMNLATGFTPGFDVSLTYSDDPKWQGLYNTAYIQDKVLSDSAKDLKLTDPKDKEGYSAKWLKFQKRWNELVPMIPLYSDEYHAFFSNKLKDYEADGFWTFTSAILYAYVEE